MEHLSHIVGVVLTPPTVSVTGPDSGTGSASPNTWTLELPSSPVADTKYLILHFTNAHLPGNNRIEVELGYDKDVFRAADGTDFWTRPVNVKALAGAPVVVKYITDGAVTGGVQLDKFGVGERHIGQQDPTSLSNCDPFFTTPTYTEPKYDPFWYCSNPPNWENVGCADPTDTRAQTARSVGMIITPEGNVVSTCTVTLIGSDQVITAGHCHSPEEALASSITFDYQTDCAGNRLLGYNPRFFKVKEVLNHRFDSTGDFSRLRLATAPPGVPPLQLRPDLPGVGEQIFGIHHPNGAVKKLSIPHTGFSHVVTSSPAAVQVPTTFHVSGGSSGSALFDSAGHVLGVLSRGNPCIGSLLSYFPTSSILSAIAPVPPTPVIRDVMIVFDRSGSMAELDPTGRTKMEVAKDAVSLFVQLIRSGVGNRVGLVSFSTTATTPFSLAAVDASTKLALIGPAPFASGQVGMLVPGGTTSIGAGLFAARLQLAGPSTNPRAILLMTDGMQNTPPLVGDVEGLLTGIDVHAVGLGGSSNLDGLLLSNLATNHHGQYTAAGSGVALQKFFSHAFGNIFETGTLMDPEFDLPSTQRASNPFNFRICGEEEVTVAVGWDKLNARLAIRLTTPSGALVTGSSPGVEQASGRSWTFLRVPLPRNGEGDGGWKATVFRAGDNVPLPLHYFINVIPTGGARLLRARDDTKYYTGDMINPLVFLRTLNGSWPADANVRMTLSRPNASVGTILSRNKMRGPLFVAGDTIPARQATLGKVAPNVTAIPQKPVRLSDNSSAVGGVFEEAGLFGSPLVDQLITEGDFLFHFRAEYGEGCVATRELLWSLHVDVGIDPSFSDITISFADTLPDGQRTGNLTIIPRDRYRNHLGPGRTEGMKITGSAGTKITGPIIDNSFGSYTVPILWYPGSGAPPRVIIRQPGRPPIVVQQPDFKCGTLGASLGSMFLQRSSALSTIVPILTVFFGLLGIVMFLRRRRPGRQYLLISSTPEMPIEK